MSIALPMHKGRHFEACSGRAALKDHRPKTLDLWVHCARFGAAEGQDALARVGAVLTVTNMANTAPKKTKTSRGAQGTASRDQKGTPKKRTNGPGPKTSGKGAMGKQAASRLERRPTRPSTKPSSKKGGDELRDKEVDSPDEDDSDERE